MPIEFKDINLGGIADSKDQGLASSVAALVGLDVHSSPGLIKCNQRLIKDSGTTVDDAVSSIVPCSDGSTYFFGKTNGKIWKRTSGGVWSLETTAAPAAGTVGIMDAKEFDGYIYYSMQSRLGRWQVGTAWSTRDDNFATFPKADPTFHPIIISNLVLYVGDASQLHDVDGGVFHADRVHLDTKYRIKTLGEMNNDLVIGTFVADNVNIVVGFRWNTWSSQVSTHDSVPETAINSFLPTDNYVLAQCGYKGNFYTYDGSFFQQAKRLQGDWTGTNKAEVKPNAVAFFGLPLFGISNLSGNPCLQGVYSFGGYANNYPKVLALEYVISTGHTSNIEIHAIQTVGDLLFVAWKDLTGGTSYGVDVLDTANKYAGGYLETRIIRVDRINKKQLTAYIPYRSLPTGTDVTLLLSVNNGVFASVALTPDVDRLLKKATDKMPEGSFFQLRLTLTPSANLTPEVEGLIIE
ncbi:MAG: hypothetical protein PHC53_02675 [Patescibacteria group bacterium]|nr:hypothetical protein [Patescibacteria group bacterium]